MFNQLIWNIYHLGQTNQNIRGIWGIVPPVKEGGMQFALYVNEIYPFISDHCWIDTLGTIKSSCFQHNDNDGQLTFSFSGIFNESELLYLNFYESERYLLQSYQKLDLLFHKDKAMPIFKIEQLYNKQNLNIVNKDLSSIEETFYLTCFRIARLLQRNEVWEAKLFEQDRLRFCFYELIYFIPSDEVIEGRHLNKEIKECLNNFQVNTTFERIFFYIRIFELVSAYLNDKQIIISSYSHKKHIKILLTEMYYRQQLEKLMTLSK